MVKTFIIRHSDAREMLERIHALGFFEPSITWNADIDERLNALTFRINYTAGGGAEEKERMAIKALEDYIKTIDVERAK